MENFLSMVKVLRMLYGPEVATEYFEKQISQFGEFSLKDLQTYSSYYKLNPTQDN